MGNPIVIVGVGALGSHVALFLRNLPHELVLVDFDRVENKNILGQFHTAMGAGRNKAMALQQVMSGMFKVKTTAVPHKLDDHNLGQVLQGRTAALILDCTDNIRARCLIQGYVQACGLPCLHGALSADGTFGRIMWTEHFKPDAEGTEGQATCEGGENLPFHGLVAAKVAQVTQEFLKTGKRSSWQVAGGTFIRLA